MRLLVFTLILAVAGEAFAQDKRAQEALRRLQATNQRLAADRAQLEREKTKLLEEKEAAAKAREALEGELGSARGGRARAEKALKAKAAENEALAARLAEAAKREEALKEKLARTEKLLAGSRQDGEQLKARLANQSETIGFWRAKTTACQEKNGELAALGHELAERYRGKTCADINLENEPFTGIRRARMENLLEDYKDRIRAQRFDWRKDEARETARQ